MNSKEQAGFYAPYQQHLTELKLQGLARATVDTYSRAVRRISNFFDCCPDRLTQSQMKTFFASLVDSHSCSTVKLGRMAFSFSTAMFWTSNRQHLTALKLQGLAPRKVEAYTATMDSPVTQRW